jgi:hypothetical protein
MSNLINRESDIINPKQAEEEKVEYVCDYFTHNPKKVDKGLLEHIHKCTNSKNVTGRCGFNSTEDSLRCKLYKNNQKREEIED